MYPSVASARKRKRERKIFLFSDCGGFSFGRIVGLFVASADCVASL